MFLRKKWRRKSICVVIKSWGEYYQRIRWLRILSMKTRKRIVAGLKARRIFSKAFMHKIWTQFDFLWWEPKWKHLKGTVLNAMSAEKKSKTIEKNNLSAFIDHCVLMWLNGLIVIQKSAAEWTSLETCQDCLIIHKVLFQLYPLRGGFI